MDYNETKEAKPKRINAKRKKLERLRELEWLEEITYGETAEDKD